MVGSWREEFADSIGPWCIVESVCALDQELYLRERARREAHLNQVVVPAIQDWLARHPLPPRPKFPIELVTSVRAQAKLVARQHEGRKEMRNGLVRPVYASKDARKRHWSLIHLGNRLGRALDFAREGTRGDQKQALAWDILERESDSLLEFPDLPDDLRAVCESARNRRQARADPGD